MTNTQSTKSLFTKTLGEMTDREIRKMAKITNEAHEIKLQIEAIRSAANGMGHEPNAGQQNRINALQAQLEALEV